MFVILVSVTARKGIEGNLGCGIYIVPLTRKKLQAILLFFYRIYSGKLAGAAPGSPLKPRVYTEENFKVGKSSPQYTNLYFI